MLARTPRPSRVLAAVARSMGLVAFLALVACEEDPNLASAWVSHLDNPNEFKEAVRNLDRIKDLKAVPAIGKAWKKWNKPSVALLAIINIARYKEPPCCEQGVTTCARELGCSDYKRVPDFVAAMPFLIEAVEQYEPSVEQSVADATVACDALGLSGSGDAIGVLVATAEKAAQKTEYAKNRVRAAAILALGKFRDPRATTTLIKILEADPEKQPIHLNAAAAIALAASGDAKALDALAKGLFIDRIYHQVRGGITRVGRPAIPKLLAMLEGKDEVTNKMAAERKFDQIAPGAVAFKAALLLGDMRSREAVGPLLALLAQPARTVGIREEAGEKIESPTTTHSGVLSALKLIGPSPEAADGVWKYAQQAGLSPDKQAQAIDVYSFLAPAGDVRSLGAGGVGGPLFAIIQNPEHDPTARLATIMAFARLAVRAEDAKMLRDLGAKYESESAIAEAKMKAAANAGDYATQKEASLISADLAATCKESSHRIDMAVECGSKPEAEQVACYANALKAKDVENGKPGLPRAERALLELYKLGPAAGGALKILLEEAGTSVRVVREMILIALPRVAGTPEKACDECEKRLALMLASQQTQTTLDALNNETRVIQNYFAWAGKK